MSCLMTARDGWILGFVGGWTEYEWAVGSGVTIENLKENYKSCDAQLYFKFIRGFLLPRICFVLLQSGIYPFVFERDL